jgi:adenine deaminase
LDSTPQAGRRFDRSLIKAHDCGAFGRLARRGLEINPMDLDRIIDVAAGRKPADLVFRNGSFVNIFTNTVEEADVAVAGEYIAGIGNYDGREVVDLKGQVLCPGFIDGHVHIESSTLSVPEFARTVVTHGTTAVVADPHEIANVMGTEGIRFFLRSSKHCPIDIYIMLSSCVPASRLESGGAELSAVDLLPFLSDPWVLGLAEMMDFNGVIHKDPEVLDKIRIVGKTPIDGHAPGVAGKDLCAYIAAGIRSDHEACTPEEGAERLRRGMYLMIREGSAARNFDALIGLVTPDTMSRVMFVTDDKHVDELINEGHIDCLVRRAIAAGIKPAHAVRLASFNAAHYYGLDTVGAIGPGYLANLTILENLKTCRVTSTYRKGALVAQDGRYIAEDAASSAPPLRLRSSINVKWLEPDAFLIRVPTDKADGKVRVIQASPGQLVTRELHETPAVLHGTAVADPDRDLLKLAVVERHSASGNTGLGFVRGFGLKRGALAGTVAHDAHNLIVIGTNDHDMLAAAIHLVKIRGGLCVVANGEVLADVPLPIAGLLSESPAATVVDQFAKLRRAARELGSPLDDPFMTLAFMSLSVIGDLKVTDCGLVDVANGCHVGLFV